VTYASKQSVDYGFTVPRILHVSYTSPETDIIAQAAQCLRRGDLVAFPTETVYGLGALGLNGSYVRRIFEAKQRPAGHPLILHVDGVRMAKRLASEWPAAAEALAAAFWPGPLTLVVARTSIVPPEVTGGLGTVGVRCPRHPVAHALIQAVNEPIAAPSANAHMHISPTRAEHVVRSLADRVGLVLDGGACSHGIESTVVDVTSYPPRVLRAGAVWLADLREVVADVVFDDAIVVAPNESRASPGLASKHYAPRTRVVIGPPGDDFEGSLQQIAASHARVGAIVWSEPAQKALRASDAKPRVYTALESVAVLPGDARAYARSLFSALYDADGAELDVLVIEQVPGDASWWAVRDRLRRAASSDDGSGVDARQAHR